MKKTMKKQPLNEQFIRMQTLAGIITENQTGNLFQFVKDNKEQIANLNPEFTEIIMDSGVSKLTPNLWDEEDYFSGYEDEGYSYDRFMKDWKTYNPEVIVLGDELASVFVTDKALPKEFANTLSSNDEVFFGSKKNTNNAFKKYNVSGKTLYIVWGISDPGS
jgi:hypothetical protein